MDLEDLRRLEDGFWVWRGDWVTHKENKEQYIAIHKTGKSQIKCKTAQEILERFSRKG